MRPSWYLFLSVCHKYAKLLCYLGLRPCVAFLGFNISPDLGECIRRNSEGLFHRPARSEKDTKYILEHPFTPEELEDFKARKYVTMQNLLRNSLNSKYGLVYK
jgi:hypothetical protein